MAKNRNNTAAAPAPAPAVEKITEAPAADKAQDTGTVEAAEQANPDGVATTTENVEDADDSSRFETLYGSSLQPALIDIGGEEVQLGTVVAAAHLKSGLSVAEWNAQAEEAREAAVAAMVDQMRAEAAEKAAAAADKAQDTQAPAGESDYAVAWSIKFNGKRYNEGDSVQLTPEQAAPFLASGAIVKA